MSAPVESSREHTSLERGSGARSRLQLSALIVGGFFLLSMAYFWKVVLLHQVLVPLDLLYSTDRSYSAFHDPLWQAPVGSSGAPYNALDSDNLMQFYPWLAFSTWALHHATIPFWNPFAFAGTPFLAAMQPAVLYPINIVLEWMMPAQDAIGWRAIAHVTITLVGTFLFARRLQLSRGGALVAALSFGLSLPYVVWIEHPMGAAFAWLPWLMLGVERLVSTRGNLRWLLGTAIAVVLEILSGHGETTAHVMILCGAYALFLLGRAWHREGGGARFVVPLVSLSAALLLGLALSAPHLFPALAQIPLSEEGARRTAFVGASLLGEPKQWTTLILAFVPNFFGNPTWHVSVLPVANYDETALYAGALPLLLACFSLVRRREAHVAFFAGVAVIALGMALRLPVLGMLNDLPGLRLILNGRLRVEWAFAVALLAGYGIDSIARAPRRLWRLTRTWVVVTGLLTAPSLVLLQFYPRLFAAIRGRPAVLSLLNRVYPGLQDFLSSHSFTRTLTFVQTLRVAEPLLWLVLFLGVLWLYRRDRLTALGVTRAAAALVAVDLFLAGSGYHASVPQAQAMRVPPAVQVVQRDRSLYRVVGLGTALLPSFATLYGLQDIRGYDPAYGVAYERFFIDHFSAKPGMILTLGATSPSVRVARYLDLMNVKYLFASCGVRMDRRLYPLVYRGVGCVYRNAGLLPRARVLHAVRWRGLNGAILDSTRNTDLRSTAIVDATARERAVWAVLPVKTRLGVGPERVRVARYEANRIDLVASTSSRGILVFADVQAPGWTALLDGRPTPLLRVDSVFRGVFVGPGTHRIHFGYVPEGFARGLAVAEVGGAGWGVLFLFLAATSSRRALGRRSKIKRVRRYALVCESEG